MGNSFYGGGLILDGSGGSSTNQTKILYNTKEEWNAQPGLVSEKKTFYVYTNYKTEDEKDIPGLKLGDGINYLIDLPFIAAGEQDLTQVFEHIRNAAIHVSPEDRESWDSATQQMSKKVTVYQSQTDPQNIVFSW